MIRVCKRGHVTGYRLCGSCGGDAEPQRVRIIMGTPMVLAGEDPVPDTARPVRRPAFREWRRQHRLKREAA